MSKKAFDKIAEGLREALSVARGEAKPARLHILPDNAPLHVIGVIRDRNLDKSSAITVLFSGPIGDADLREFHEYVSKWRIEMPIGGAMTVLNALAPGPWTADEDSVGMHWTHSVSVKDADGSEVCVLTRGYEGDQNGETCPSWQNAKLIAAAPDLLAALEWALDRLLDAKNVCYGGVTIEEINERRVAVAKATEKTTKPA